MDYKYEDCRIGRGDELKGKNYLLYRFYEILPGFLSWATILLALVFSWTHPMQTAIFIIAFDVFWLLKTVYLSLHLRTNWKRIIKHINTDWAEKLKSYKHDHIYHMIMLPFYKEDESIVEKTIATLLECRYNTKKMIVVLAAEKRAGEESLQIAASIEKKYGSRFGHFIFTVHPDGIAGELAGKGSNIAYAAEMARTEILDKYNIPYSNVLVSAFDIDTIVTNSTSHVSLYCFFKVKGRIELHFNPYLFSITIFTKRPLFRALWHIQPHSGKWSSRKGRKGLPHSVLIPYLSTLCMRSDTGRATW
jgi:cellulose synthase/poly-beta-1,6-N-acetylglucosamine synthase-like glycosyltransferase